MNDILAATPLCCRVEPSNSTLTIKKATILPIKERKTIKNAVTTLLDQEGKALSFRNLIGKPFVLTFFYTSCTNPLKCAATVDRLGKLQKLFSEKKTEKEVGIYAMTYDANFDSPSILKKYGNTYGLAFSDNMKFLVPKNNSEQQLFEQLDIRVNYGYGSVNQHGIQLFLIDKKGRISVVYDNDLWEVQNVYENLMRLVNE